MKINHIILIAAILAVNASQSDAQISVHYRETANIFEILDNVGDWWPGFAILFTENTGGIAWDFLNKAKRGK